jgi:putative nucleotidyltransferase with HDIG domain
MVSREVMAAPREVMAAPREVMAAALLHDVGKVDADLGTFSRVAVTLVAIAAGRQRLVDAGAARPGTWVGRAGLYLSHDGLGAGMLEEAGSDPVTVSWAAEHHLPATRWSIDRRIGDALKAADGD